MIDRPRPSRRSVGTIGPSGLALAFALASCQASPPSAPNPVAPVAPPDCAMTLIGDRPGPQVRIPAGQFMMGDTVYPEEGPRVSETVGAFMIDRYEVTNAQFARFVAATGYVTRAELPLDPAAYPDLPPDALAPGSAVFQFDQARFDPAEAGSWWRFVRGASWRHPEGPGSALDGRSHQPVVHIALADAEAYARWAGRRLPTEVEWEWAARAADPQSAPSSSQPSEANTWQGVFPVVNQIDDGYVGAAPVGCFAANALGVYDLIGNVWEWTSDPYEPRRGAGSSGGAGHDPLQPGTPVSVIKGGSYLCAPNYCMRYRPGARHAQDRTLGASHIGFRTAGDPVPSQPGQ